jgi:resuscitation-promoting factor RpfB
MFMAGVAAALLALGGCSAAAGDDPIAPRQVAEAGIAPTGQSELADGVQPETTDAADTDTSTADSKVVKKTVTTTKKIAFSTRTVKDGSLAKGKKRTMSHGLSGVRTLTYEITLTGGKQTAKKLIKSEVTRKPVAQVIAIGTQASPPKSQCDPNYSGACVPIASDVDCAGGSGNGPAYVDGPVTVIGDDVYDLDRDGDGTACDR